MSKKRLKSIELFAGAGGLSEGFAQEGFTIAAASDFDHDCGLTHQANHPTTPFLEIDVTKLPSKILSKEAGVRPGEVDVITGGPPCQGFSVNAPRRILEDPRNSLFKHFARLVKDLRPKFVVLENVPGMLSLEHGVIVQAIKREFGKLGYNMDCKVLYAPEYGVPQERRRLVFIGNRIGKTVDFPAAMYSQSGNDGFERYVTVKEAILDLPKPVYEDSPITYTKKPYSIFSRMMRGNSDHVRNHVISKIASVNLQRMRYIPPGGSWRDIPIRLLPLGMRHAKRSDHTKRYGRLHPDGLASTILTKCDPHWGAYFHPLEDRTITVREAARFQTFPDKYIFLGNRASQYKQVGNAVPVLLARAIARVIKNSL